MGWTEILLGLLGIGAIAQQQQIIKGLEDQKNQITNNQWQYAAILQSQIESSKQTLEVIKLTRQIKILTIALVIIGVVQIIVMILK